MLQTFLFFLENLKNWLVSADVWSLDQYPQFLIQVLPMSKNWQLATSRYQERILGCQFLFFIQYFFIFFKSSKKEVFKVSHIIIKFSFQVPKCCNGSRHFLAISWEIPWNFKSKMVWISDNCLWFAEKMWDTWDS